VTPTPLDSWVASATRRCVLGFINRGRLVSRQRRSQNFYFRWLKRRVYAPWFCSFRLWRSINHLLTYMYLLSSPPYPFRSLLLTPFPRVRHTKSRSKSTSHSSVVGSVYSVSQKIPPNFFLTFFRKRLVIFNSNFTCLLYVPIYAELQIFIKLSATLTKLYTPY